MTTKKTTMETKYYTPKIEEIRVGFEFELKNSSDETLFDWESVEIIDVDRYKMSGILTDFNFNDFRNAIKEKYIRVKHIDKDDILSLKFREVEFEFVSKVAFSHESENGQYIILPYPYQPNFFRICKSIGEIFTGEVIHLSRDQVRVFEGTLKNISELKQVLEMVGFEN